MRTLEQHEFLTFVFFVVAAILTGCGGRHTPTEDIGIADLRAEPDSSVPRDATEQDLGHDVSPDIPQVPCTATTAGPIALLGFSTQPLALAPARDGEIHALVTRSSELWLVEDLLGTPISTRVGNDQIAMDRADLLVEGSGAVHVLYVGQGKIARHAYRSPGGQFRVVEAEAPASGTSCLDVALGRDAVRPYIALVLERRGVPSKPDAQWVQVAAIDTKGWIGQSEKVFEYKKTDFIRGQLSLGADTKGWMHVGWQEDTIYTVLSRDPKVGSVGTAPLGSWTRADVGSASWYTRSTSLVTSPMGAVHALHAAEDHLVASPRGLAYSVGTAATAAWQKTVLQQGGLVRCTAMAAIDSETHIVHATEPDVWPREPGKTRAVYRWKSEGVWQSRDLSTGPDLCPDLVASPNGALHLLYHQAGVLVHDTICTK